MWRDGDAGCARGWVCGAGELGVRGWGYVYVQRRYTNVRTMHDARDEGCYQCISVSVYQCISVSVYHGPLELETIVDRRGRVVAHCGWG